MHPSPHQIEEARLLVSRLERISADSIWARRASGLRGNLLKWIERYDQPQIEKNDCLCRSDQELEKFSFIIESGFKILENAARERLR